MNSEKETFQQKFDIPKSLFYRFSQFVGFLLGARFFVAILLTFALYVSTFFLFNQDENFRKFVFDFKVHGIIFCTVLTILAGGIINQFYDFEKDHIVKPFRSRLAKLHQTEIFSLCLSFFKHHFPGYRGHDILQGFPFFCGIPVLYVVLQP